MYYNKPTKMPNFGDKVNKTDKVVWNYETGRWNIISANTPNTITKSEAVSNTDKPSDKSSVTIGTKELTPLERFKYENGCPKKRWFLSEGSEKYDNWYNSLSQDKKVEFEILKESEKNLKANEKPLKPKKKSDNMLVKFVKQASYMELPKCLGKLNAELRKEDDKELLDKYNSCADTAEKYKIGEELTSKKKKRRGKIEKAQKDVINIAIGEQILNRHSYEVFIDNKQWFFKECGDLVVRNRDNYNPAYDSKTLDYSILLRDIDSGDEIRIMFVLKGTEGDGGHQYNVDKEIGDYTKYMATNSDDNVYFFFVLDGSHWTDDAVKRLHIGKNYTISNSTRINEDISEYLRNVLCV